MEPINIRRRNRAHQLNKSVNISKTSFKAFCSNLSQFEAARNYDDSDLAKGVKYSNQFKNIQIYQPSARSLKNKKRIVESREIQSIDQHPRIQRSGAFQQCFNMASPNPPLSLKPFKLAKITDTHLSLDRKLRNNTSIFASGRSKLNLSKCLPKLELISTFGEDLAQPYYNRRQSHSKIASVVSDRYETARREYLEKKKEALIRKQTFRKINHLGKDDLSASDKVVQNLRSTGLREHF